VPQELASVAEHARTALVASPRRLRRRMLPSGRMLMHSSKPSNLGLTTLLRLILLFKARLDLVEIVAWEMHFDVMVAPTSACLLSSQEKKSDFSTTIFSCDLQAFALEFLEGIWGRRADLHKIGHVPTALATK